MMRLQTTALSFGARVKREIAFEVRQFQGFEDVLTVLVRFDSNASSDFGKNCANSSGCLLFCNSRWTKGWKVDRSGSWTTASAKDMKIYIN